MMKTFRFTVSLALLVAMWEIVVLVTNPPTYILPSPLSVISTLVHEIGPFLSHAVSTFSNAFWGGVIGIAGGLLIGFGCALSKSARWVAEPYLTIFQSFPREAFFPLIVVWLGFGDLPKVVNAALLSMFPMAIITLDSLTNTRKDYMDLLNSWSATRLEIFVNCRLPAAVPALVGGVRVAAPLALIGAVLGEFLGGSRGLGYVIVSAGSSFRVDRAFAAIIILALGGTLLVLSIDAIKEKFLIKYYQR